MSSNFASRLKWPSVAAFRSDRAIGWVGMAFIVMAIISGGGSRPDIVSLVLLRPISLLVFAYFLWVVLARRTVGVGTLFWLLVGWAVLHIVQLVPLPHAVWSGLPERAQIAGLDNTLGMAEQARPLTLSPSGTVNSLFSLFAPAAALLLAVLLPGKLRDRMFNVLKWAGLVSILFGLMQLVGGPGSSFYLYRVTNSESAVGLFSNRNHHALFLACVMVIAAFHLRDRLANPKGRQLGLLIDAALLLLAPMMILLIGSRGGLLFAGVAALFAVAAIASISNGSLQIGARRTLGATADRSVLWFRRHLQKLVLAAGVVLALGLTAVSIFLSRAPAFERFFAPEHASNARSDVLPTLIEMAKVYFPFGSGFGSFDGAYRKFEPIELLSPFYLNEAHNDWVQLVIEGGAPAVAILLAGLAALGWSWFRGLGRRPEQRWTLIGYALMLGFFAVSSAVDYPLRTPSLMVFAAFCAGSIVAIARGGGEVVARR